MEKKAYILLTLLLLISFVVAPASFAISTDTKSEESSDVMMPEESKKISIEERKAEYESQVEEIKQKREDLKSEIKEKREEAKAAMESNREEFQTKLQALQDEKKAVIVKRVDTRLTERNQRITDRLIGHLDRISAILDKMEEKLVKIQDVDTSDVDGTIAAARDAVLNAQTIIATQTGNTYVIELGDEDELKTVVQSTVDEFREDMRKAIDAVKVAHSASVEAAQSLADFRKAHPPVTPSEGMMKQDASGDDTNVE